MKSDKFFKKRAFPLGSRARGFQLADEQEIQDDPWPPAPNFAPLPEPSIPTKVWTRWLGMASLGLSGIGSLCWLIDALNDDHPITMSRSEAAIWNILAIGGLGFLFIGLLLGIFSWRYWTGRFGIALAVISPIWIWLDFRLRHFDFGHM